MSIIEVNPEEEKRLHFNVPICSGSFWELPNENCTEFVKLANVNELENVNKLLQEKCSHLEEEVKKLNYVVQMLWDSPGMPGYLGVEKSFYDRLATNSEMFSLPSLNSIVEQQVKNLKI